MDNEIVFRIENPQQFWSELEDTIKISPSSNLVVLDGALRKYVFLCAGFHEQYLQAPLQFDHACSLLLESELFEFHSGRMTNILVQDATTNTDPHAQLVLHKLLLSYGYHNPTFLRFHRKWKPLIPILMDHLMVDFDLENEDPGGGPGNSTLKAAMGIPIEVALRLLAVDVLYQICRVQKLDLQDLQVFNDQFISTLFDLVEQTRDMLDDTLNYSIIKLIIALNEQFMLASLPSHKHHPSTSQDSNQKAQNRVFVVLLRRLHFSKTFGQNIIFMLNRADCSNSENHCLQLLILKVLYLLFTTPGTQEYFYTNDLRVLVDVFIRNLSDLGDENESLRHTYLRVLHPLLTNTQLKNNPYKGMQILRTLERLVDKADIREVSSTTKRLVDRCLGGGWCINLRRQGLSSPTSSVTTADSNSDQAPHSSLTSSLLFTTQGGTTHFIVTASSTSAANVSSTTTSASRLSNLGTKERTLKPTRSFGDLKRKAAKSTQAPPIPVRKGAHLMTPSESTSSATSLNSVSAAESNIKNGTGKHGNPPIRSNTDPDSGLSTPTSSHSTRKISSPLSNGVAGDVLPVSSSHASKHRERDLLGGGYQSMLNASTPSLALSTSHSHGSVSNGGGDPPKRRKPPPIPARRSGASGASKSIRSASASISAIAQ